MISRDQVIQILARAGVAEDKLPLVADNVLACIKAANRPPLVDPTARQRARRYRSRLNLTERQWRDLSRQVFARDGYTCQYCGARPERPHCDHYVPLIKGGSNDLSNLKTACGECNSSKSGKHPSDWRGRL